MTRYTATFHTHLSALLSARALSEAGISARMAPVPRCLSSSCGTCVVYDAEEPHRELLDVDMESVYRQEQSGEYSLLLQNS